MGGGSGFRIALPIVACGELAGARQHSVVEPDLPVGGRVLVIDDDRAIREAQATALGNWGLQALVAASQDEAIALLDGVDGVIALLIADYRLGHWAGDSEGVAPDDGPVTGRTVTGIDVIEALERRVGRTLPALLISGDTGSELPREVQQRGYRMLQKPVEVARLRTIGEDEIRRAARVAG